VSTPQTSRWRSTLRASWPWLVPALVCAVLAMVPPPLLIRLNDGAADVVRRALPTRPPDPRVVIVDVDEASLASLGQWPWRRDRLGALVERLRELGARVIALDLVFSEPDRAGEVYASPDAAFAAALRGGRVVVGYALTFGRKDTRGTDCRLHPLPMTVVEPAGAAGHAPMFEADGAVCSLPTIAEAAAASGFLNATPDSDGILRRAPLVIGWRGAVYPSLGLAAVLTLLPSAPPALHVVNANTSALTLGDRAVPLDGRSNLLLRFRGPRRTFPYVAAADVIEGRAPAGVFQNRIVFVGATALGTQELVATPQDPRFIGVEVQATVADNLLQGDFLRRPADAPLLEALAALAVAALLALVAGRLGISWTGAADVAGLVALWGGSWWLMDRWGVVVSPLMPSASVVFSSAGLALAVTARALGATADDLRRARADAEAASQAHQDFLANVSRELRTPLSAIQGYARMVGKGALSDDSKMQVLAAIERHALAQTRVIDDLFEASRAAGGRLRLMLQEIDLTGIVRSTVDVLRPAIAARRLVFTFDSDEDVGRVSGDAERLRLAVWHLLSNAVKFTPEEGHVDVRLVHESGAAVLIVRDTGPGIPAEEVPMLFTSHPAAGRAGEVSGLRLGLPLVRHIVELHGGSIAVTSDGPGAGASFRVSVPIHRGAPATARPAPLPSLGGIRVVLVAEHADERGRMAAALLHAGASVVTAGSSQDALALMRDDSRDVLVVAIGTGERNGYWLAREALAISLNRGERLAIVVVGTEGHAEERARMPEVTVERHLTAPVDPDQLVFVVADVASNGHHHAG
jgi:signal transduction histidine kinase/CheY-like chemotaxis protein